MNQRYLVSVVWISAHKFIASWNGHKMNLISLTLKDLLPCQLWLPAVVAASTGRFHSQFHRCCKILMQVTIRTDHALRIRSCIVCRCHSALWLWLVSLVFCGCPLRIKMAKCWFPIPTQERRSCCGYPGGGWDFWFWSLPRTLNYRQTTPRIRAEAR